MPQKPLDASDKTMRLTLRLTKRQTDVIDQLRGSQTRSSYLRTLIDNVIYPGPLNENKAMAHDGYTEPVRVTREPAKRHYCRFVKGEVYEYVRGVPQYRQKCECGKTKVGA